MSSEIAERARFDRIRYAQCWEDADVLLEGLDPKPGFTGLSIASAGDNAFALLARAPERLVVVDLNPTQLACVELRARAYRALQHAEFLELIGSRPSTRREELYRRCAEYLGSDARRFWDANMALVRRGIGTGGKFESYFALFRRCVLPLVHRRNTVLALMEPRELQERHRFYDERWDTWRWRCIFRLFFSRTVMGRLGRDPKFFDYVEGSVGDRILQRTRYALRELSPSANPYLQWILLGRHGSALPFALREENYEAIRENIDRMSWRLSSIEEILDEEGEGAFDAYNLSDIFEYMSQENTNKLLAALAKHGRPGARLAYWNMLAPRRSPEELHGVLRPLDELAARCFAHDKAFFYSAFVVEEVIG